MTFELTNAEAEPLRGLGVVPLLEFYDRFSKPGAYVPTRADHIDRLHGRAEEI